MESQTVEKDRLHLEYERGGDTIQVQILDQEAATFTADELSGVIRLLADARKALLPPVEISNPVAGQTVQIALTTRWYVDHRPNGNQVLMLLHMGLGWIAIDLSPAEAERVSGLLMQTFKPGSIPRAN